MVGICDSGRGHTYLSYLRRALQFNDLERVSYHHATGLILISSPEKLRRRRRALPKTKGRIRFRHDLRLRGRDEQKAIHSRADYRDTSVDGCRDIPGEERDLDLPGDRDFRTDLLPMAERIWGDESNPGQAFERSGEGEQLSEA